MSVSSINDTVQSALQNAGLGSYGNQVRPIVDRLVQREAQIAREVIDFAVGEGMDADAARTNLSNIGMHVPVVEPASVMTGTPAGTVASAVEQNEGGGDVGALLARIANQLDGLTTFARENGYRG